MPTTQSIVNTPASVATQFGNGENVSRTTMSSRDMAELVGLRHDNVKRTIDSLAQKGVIGSPQIEEYLDSLRRPAKQYLVGKRDSFIVVAQLCPEFTARLVDRWQELEEQATQQVAMPSYAEALRLFADQIEQTAVLRIENHQQASKIHSMENLFKEGMTHTQFCKGLNGVNVMQVGKFLEGRNWLYNESKSGLRFRVASYARDKYMTEHQHEVTPHGKEPFVSFTPVLLKKGAVRLYDLYLAGELPMKKTWDGLFTHDKALRAA